MSTPLRYGIVGVGMMGVEHIHNIAALDGALLTAIADPHAPSLSTALAAAGGPGDRESAVHTFDGHEALLDAAVCDVVVIASPNHTHIEILRDVLATDVHVLIEKPLCTNVADCEEVVALTAARKAGVTAVGLEYRFMPSTTRFVDEIRSGVIGTLAMLSIREHRFPFLQKVDDWNRFNANTGGTLVEKCCHFFDLMRHVVGADPIRVVASGSQRFNHLDESYADGTPDILDNAYVIVEFANDVRAMLDLCMFAEATMHSEELVAVGDRGKIESLLPQGLIRLGRRGEHFFGGVDEFATSDERVAYAGFHHGASFLEHVDLLDAIRSGRPPAVNVVDGLWSVAMGVAAHRSIDEGRPVEMTEVLGSDTPRP